MMSFASLHHLALFTSETSDNSHWDFLSLQTGFNGDDDQVKFEVWRVRCLFCITLTNIIIIINLHQKQWKPVLVYFKNQSNMAQRFPVILSFVHLSVLQQKWLHLLKYPRFLGCSFLRSPPPLFDRCAQLNCQVNDSTLNIRFFQHWL